MRRDRGGFRMLVGVTEAFWLVIAGGIIGLASSVISLAIRGTGGPKIGVEPWTQRHWMLRFTS